MTPDLSPNQVKAIALLAQGQNVESVASELGLNRKTVDRWKDDPTFDEVLRDTVRCGYEQALSLAVNYSSEAVAVLQGIMVDEDSSNRDRISAAKEILATAGKYHSLEIEARLTEIENSILAITEAEKWRGR